MKPPRNRHDVIRRVLWLAQALRIGKPFTAETAAAELRTVSRTVKRDLLLLRQLGWRIRWIKPEHTYALSYAPRPKLL